jgi:gliding motility-associated-like protein
VDVDKDFHSECVFNVIKGGMQYFIAIAGNDSLWNPSRPIWNEGSFYYSSIRDNLDLSERSYQNWKDYNLYRCQPIAACGLGVLMVDSIICIGCEVYSNLTLHANIINTNSLILAPGSRVKIEILQGEEYMSLISGVDEIYLGDIAPADSVDAIWTYEVDGSCLWEELKIRIQTSSIDSGNIQPTYYDFRIRLPRCADFPEIVNVRPLPCNGVMTCPDTVEQMIILCVTSKYFPINYEETKLYVDDEIFTIESENVFQYDDNLVYFPSEPFKNGDSIVYYLFSTTSIGCTTISLPCTVVVDLQPPIFYNEIPSNNSTVETVPDHFQALLTDSIAGVRWSSLDSAVAHFTSMYNTIDLPIILEDSLVIVQFDGLMILGPIEICFENILDDPTIEYCEPNVLDTCFRFNVEPKIAAIPVFPDSGAYNGCLDGVIKMFFNFHEYPIDLSTVILEINDSIILGIDRRLSLIDGDTLLFSPDLGFWMDSTWIDVCLRQANDIHSNELAESPVCWGFWNDFSPPVSEMISPVRPQPIRFIDQVIDIQIVDNLSGVDTSMLEYSLDDIYYSRDQLVWIECDTGWIVRFDPILIDLSYVPDDTIKILIYVCDNVDSIYYCGPNCQDFQFFLPVMIIDECQRFPNPFTPNSDGLNDFVQFYFPDFGVKPGDVFIFDIYNKEVKEIQVPKGLDCKENARWDGTDRDGNSLPQGVYIYLIKIDGEIICQGTVSIAR